MVLYPEAKRQLLPINELGDKSLEEQGFLQDVMEEGYFTLNKHGINASIRADTVIIWTSNPKQGSDWSEDKIVRLDEIPVRKQSSIEPILS